jgi:hypothetical protein
MTLRRFGFVQRDTGCGLYWRSDVRVRCVLVPVKVMRIGSPSAIRNISSSGYSLCAGALAVSSSSAYRVLRPVSRDLPSCTTNKKVPQQNEWIYLWVQSGSGTPGAESYSFYGVVCNVDPETLKRILLHNTLSRKDLKKRSRQRHPLILLRM